MTWQRVFENPTERGDRTFHLRDYLGPGNRRRYEQLPLDMEAAFAEGYSVTLLSVPGFPMVIAIGGSTSKKPWCSIDAMLRGGMKCYRTAAEALRNR